MDKFVVWDAWIDEENNKMYVISIFDTNLYFSERDYNKKENDSEDYNDGYGDDNGYGDKHDDGCVW